MSVVHRLKGLIFPSLCFGGVMIGKLEVLNTYVINEMLLRIAMLRRKYATVVGVGM